MGSLSEYPVLLLWWAVVIGNVVGAACLAAWRLRKVRSFNVSPHAHAFYLRTSSYIVYSIGGGLIGSTVVTIEPLIDSGLPAVGVVVTALLVPVVGLYLVGVGELLRQRAKEQLVGFEGFPADFGGGPAPALADTTALTRLPTQSRRNGIVLRTAGTAVCLVAAAISLTGTAMLIRGTYGGWVPIIAPAITLSGLLFASGTALRRSARRHFTRVLKDPGSLRDRAFVLYLRSFRDDDRLSAPREGSWRSNGGNPVPVHLLKSGLSEEEVLGRVLRPLGTLVAIGAPGEAVPFVGAVRVYLPTEEWQEPVRDLMSRARMVVLALGPGEGTLWELVEAMLVVPPERLVLIIPMKESAYEEFRTRAARALRARRDLIKRTTRQAWTPPSLPAYVNEGGFASIQAVIHFSARWDATFVPLGRLIRRPDAAFRNVLHLALKRAVRPAVRNLLRHEAGSRSTAPAARRPAGRGRRGA